MALWPKKAFLEAINPLIQCRRFRGKINVQKPKPPHFEKAKFLALTKPWFISPYKDKTSAELCKFNVKVNKDEEEFNPLQKIYAKEIYDRLTSSKLIVFFHYNSMKADEEFKYYAMYKKQGMELKKYGKKLIKATVKGTPYEAILDFYVTQHNIMLFCPEAEISKVLKINRKCSQLVLLAAILENRLISKDDLLKYSKIPNVETAQAELVQTMNRMGSQLVSDLNAHQTTLVSNLEERIKQLGVDDK
ncbi:unnamed protein product [Diabrotica balteata]|uniref:Large ribosomal subunit protein uL10m n=1 Tax=Diabrotica balteata TaxID=107213 RepID=A0A9P0E1S7_DIABA|nr:unnamed protein product [Diabrotica balteata]